jgi:hypothetical protein
MSATSLLGPAFGLLSTAPHSHGAFGVLRKTGQGAGAGLLALSGSGALTRNPAEVAAPVYVDYASFEGLTAGLLNGAFNAPLQIAAAVLLFVAAGKCIARMIGLAIVLGGFILYSQGARMDDVYAILQSLWYRLSAAFTAFMNPAVVGG